MSGPLLALDGVSINRGEVPIVHDVTLAVRPGTITVVLGANGAGKTTLMDGIAGLAQVTSGTIQLGQAPIGKLPTYKRAQAGLGYVEQARTVFRSLTVEQNLNVSKAGDGDLGMAYGLFPELEKRRNLQAGHLSGGEQQMLVIGRALVSSPKLVMIDEMSLGLAPVIVRRLMNAVADLLQFGISVLLIEQFANLALDVGTHAYVLRKGRVVFDGPCTELRGDADRLHECYFGSVDAGAGEEGLAR
ncbi:branched-chain amino acid ABC transporter ATP-binding protein [Sphaerisporangium krabiense]|uniref:Branched-chain amino acid transport system ATP-binding protein n=1 Tax=Sphaerisporangium krabiense TaxID=763782 RepID=A0A7W8Z6H3_9ACTN|nr:ABC transporter ATP-binding protein [Sphaerisporangium krabiense]MBB5628383.1 branched-chain amino acid transport system ATP-binding protein [Sphaerisporangium krabiense]GII66877.1 branched-chain amino acid ABC transporter ATP-binding protein [Sphaerisporangium krabiense]